MEIVQATGSDAAVPKGVKEKSVRPMIACQGHRYVIQLGAYMYNGSHSKALCDLSDRMDAVSLEYIPPECSECIFLHTPCFHTIILCTLCRPPMILRYEYGWSKSTLRSRYVYMLLEGSGERNSVAESTMPVSICGGVYTLGRLLICLMRKAFSSLNCSSLSSFSPKNVGRNLKS